jgi:hypothetical protein
MEPLSHHEIVRDQPPLTDAQQAELERCLTTVDQDRREGVTWAALKAVLEQRRPLDEYGPELTSEPLT